MLLVGGITLEQLGEVGRPEFRLCVSFLFEGAKRLSSVSCSCYYTQELSSNYFHSI